MVTKAEQGQPATFKGRGFQRDVTILPSCDSKTGGQWYCVTHGVTLDNWSKEEHYAEPGKHVMAWLCNEHGLEQP